MNTLNKKGVLKKIIVLIFAIMFVGLISGEASFCCEKTLKGAWCQNSVKENCDSSYKMSPTSCDSTSYCRTGCCFDSQEGLCLESTPQRVCNSQNGTWANNEQCDIPQCNLGCCILADQAAFVTLTRCKALSGFYNLKTDFRTDITNEVQCIATAQGEDKGACVYNDGINKAECKISTRAECGEDYSVESINSSLKNTTGTFFYKDYLCSAEELGSLCGMTSETIMIQGKDEIYFKDSCDNVANIYDSEKINDKAYWKKIIKKSDSCGYGQANANSRTCGNCDYSLGSIGKESSFGSAKPTYGDYICKSLGCDNGKKHGESWCVVDGPSGKGEDPVGSRHFKQVCLFGEIITESCADFRNNICTESSFNGFTEAMCRVNRWQDCLNQEEQGDCENTNLRDCFWKTGFYFSEEGMIKKSTSDSNNDGNKADPSPNGTCVPNYPPGNIFWSAEKEETNNSYGTGYIEPSSAGAESLCKMANAKITLKWKQEKAPLKFWGNEEEKGEEWRCVNGCEYLSEEAKKDPKKVNEEDIKKLSKEFNEVCIRLGDCGGYINWLEEYTEEGYAAYYNGERKAGSGGAEILEKEKKVEPSSPVGVSGKIIKDFIKTIGGKE
jgi:hypothetical protein